MPCYQPVNRPKSRAHYLLFVPVAMLCIWLWIKVFFGAMPLLSAFGHFICHRLIGGGL